MHNSFIGSIFEGIAEQQKKKYRAYEFENLTTTPYLHGSEYLTELMGKAQYKHDYECILEHLYRHHENGRDILNIDSYKNLESKIIEKYRRD